VASGLVQRSLATNVEADIHFTVPYTCYTYMRCLPPLAEVLTEPDKGRAGQLLDGSGKLLQEIRRQVGVWLPVWEVMLRPDGVLHSGLRTAQICLRTSLL
jgi:hypothetical protein